MDNISHERLGPLLYRIVKGKELFPPEIEQRLRVLYHHNLQRNLVLQNELYRILRSLADAGVEAIVLKGMAVAELVYRNVALRQMADIDLLIHGDDLPKAIQKLSDMGYEYPGSLREEIELNNGTLNGFSYHEHMERGTSPRFIVELHRFLLGLHYYWEHLPGEWFWKTARGFSLGDTQALALGPEAQTLYLCAHLCLHHNGVETMLALQDIAELIIRYGTEIDWSLLLDRARHYHLSRCVQYVLDRLVAEWEVPILPEVIGELQIVKPGWHEQLIFSLRTGKWHYLERIVGFSNWREGLRFVGCWLFPSRAYMQRQYPQTPSYLWPLTYFQRVAGNLVRHFR